MMPVHFISCRRALERVRLYLTKTAPLVVLLLFSACTSVPYVPDGTVFTAPGGLKSARVKHGRVLANGIESQHIYTGILRNSVRFSSNGQHLAYVGHEAGLFYPVVDEVAYGPYEKIIGGEVFFTPSGDGFFTGVVQNGKWAFLINGRQESGYDGLGATSPVYSDDEKQYAYVARLKDKWVLVHNGVASNKYDGILQGTPQFTSAGKLVYASKQSQGWRVHINDWVSQPYEDILAGLILFSPDKSVVAYVGIRDGKGMVVINGKEETPYPSIGIWKTSGGKTQTSVMHIGVRSPGASYQSIPVTTSSPVRNELVSLIIFSSDSGHYAYQAFDGKTVKIIADGMVVKELTEGSILAQLEFRGEDNRLTYAITLPDQK